MAWKDSEDKTKIFLDKKISQWAKNNPEFEMENYSGGAGIDFGSSFLDLSYTISKNKSEYYMYSPSTEARTLINNDNHYFLVTLGFRY